MRSLILLASLTLGPLLLLAVIITSGRARRLLGTSATAAVTLVSQPIKATPPPPTIIGVNLTGPAWFSNDRAFANLILGGRWQFASATARGWSDLDDRFLDRDGNLTAMPPGGDVVRMLTRPETGPDGAAIRCTYSGQGAITVRGAVQNVATKAGQVTFRWTNRWDDATVWIQIHAMAAQNPITKVDCREGSLPVDARFAPDFVNALRGYRLIRFMDWQHTNANAPVTWATRHTLSSLDIASADGTALEDIVTLSRAVGAAPWVTVPWNADNDYIVRFARLLHDGLPADRPVYVELSNEVWNGIFPASVQSGREGVAMGLSVDRNQAVLLRYAQRTIEVMRLWERVFADRPTRLVRVTSTFNLLPRTAETVLSFPGLAEHVDALATAPYFGGDVMSEGPTTDTDEIFQRLDRRVDLSIAQAVANRAIATRYGKRFLAYEAGQHLVIADDLPLLQRVERDPRMYGLYKRYIAQWRAKVGDALMLFAATGPISRHGAWGLAEHSGQLPGDAPKLRAALEERDH